jgi:hypothetical protein
MACAKSVKFFGTRAPKTRADGPPADVIQRTDDGFSRDTTHTLPNGRADTRSVDATCDEDVGKCVKQVAVDKRP